MAEQTTLRRYGVLGAGSIGCYAGGVLAAAGFPVTLVGRRSLVDSVSRGGLTVVPQEKAPIHVPPEAVHVSTRVADLLPCDVIFIAVKSAGTAAAGRELSEGGRSGRTIVSLQNGIRNPGILREELPAANVLGGMVSFNVIWGNGTCFSQATSGPIVLEAGSDATSIATDLRRAGLLVLVRHDMESVQWSKLLLNLNNAVNALCGIPIRSQLADRLYRRVLAAAMQEGLTVFARAGIRMVRFGRMIPGLAPRVLRLPDWLFFRVAAAMVNIDPGARSSMYDDLARGRTTEIEELNGEIVRLGQELGLDTPVNRAIVSLVHEAEQTGRGSPGLKAQDLAAAVGIRP